MAMAIEGRLNQGVLAVSVFMTLAVVLFFVGGSWSWPYRAVPIAPSAIVVIAVWDIWRMIKRSLRLVGLVPRDMADRLILERTGYYDEAKRNFLVLRHSGIRPEEMDATESAVAVFTEQFMSAKAVLDAARKDLEDLRSLLAEHGFSVSDEHRPAAVALPPATSEQAPSGTVNIPGTTSHEESPDVEAHPSLAHISR